jgi:hypothetical protein
MKSLKDMHRFKTVNFYDKKCKNCGVILRTEITGVFFYIDNKKNKFYEIPKCTNK